MVGHLRNVRGAALGLGLLAAAVAGAANAGVVYESASYAGLDNGDYAISGNDLIGAAFTLGQSTVITGIGGAFGNPFDPDPGTIFGAIVKLDALGDFPNQSAANPDGLSADLDSIAVAHVVVSAPTSLGDYLFSLTAPVTLGPGAYAVIFGSGQFGADGFAALNGSNQAIGSPVLMQSLFDTGWDSFNDPEVRLVVSSAPEPATWGLMLAGFGGLGAMLRRRKATLAIA